MAKNRRFKDVWNKIVDKAATEGPDALEQLEDFSSAYAWARELALARKERNLSQVDVSNLTGIDQAEISKIESGSANPTVQTLGRLAAAYGLSVGLIPRFVVGSKKPPTTVVRKSWSRDVRQLGASSVMMESFGPYTRNVKTFGAHKKAGRKRSKHPV